MDASSVCILQSYDASRMMPWLHRCQASVESWATSQGFDYLFLGDELFVDVPDWYMNKVSEKLPVAADLGRLQWIKKLHDQYAAVIWVDVDVLVFDPGRLTVEFTDRDCFFGQELWLQEQDRRLKTYRNVHNAYMGFTRSSTTLPFLIDTVTRLVKNIDEAFIAPQFVGPKLLGSLHNTVGFALEPRVGALSQLWVDRYLAHDKTTLAWYDQQLEQRLCAANLCLSLHADQADRMDVLVGRLLNEGVGES
ncbi:MAG: hypothetical protein AAF541_23370 [Pseudomonadota bacterium]